MLTAVAFLLALVASFADDDGRVSGRIMSPTFEPIAGAEVALACPPLRVQRVASDRAGRFEFRSPPGNCRVIARKDGYVEASFNGPDAPGGYGIAVRAGIPHDGIELQMVRGGVINGKISAPRGTPIDEIRFQAVRKEMANGVPRLVALSYARVDGGGRYRTAPVPPGDYYIRAFPQPAGEGRTLNIAPTYFPGTVDESEAAVITVKAGDAHEASFSLVSAATFTVTGVVHDAQGKPLANASITIDDDGRPAWIRAKGKTEGDGRFSIAGVTNGRYVLWAYKERTIDQPAQIGEVHFDLNGADVEQLFVRTADRVR